MARKQFGRSISDPKDIATKGYVDSATVPSSRISDATTGGLFK